MAVLSHVPYFASLPPEDLTQVDNRMTALSWAEGDPLYQMGDRAEHLYVLASGHVKVGGTTAAGDESITDILSPGQLFGTMMTLGEPVHTDTATALVTTCALRIDQQSFRDILTQHPTVALRVLDDVAARLARTKSGMSRRLANTVPQRTAAALLTLADTVGQATDDNGTLLQLPLTRADIAALANSTPESVSRTMSEWRRSGIIDSGRRWTAILDRDRLTQIADGTVS